MYGIFENLVGVRDWTAVGAGSADAAATTEIDFSTVKTISSATKWRWVLIQSHSGEALIMTRAFLAAGTAPGTPNTGNGLRIPSGSYRIFALPLGCLPTLKIITASGAAGAGSVFFGGLLI